MNQCKKCGLIIDDDKDQCVDCFHKEFFELDKPFKESTKMFFRLVRLFFVFIVITLVVTFFFWSDFNQDTFDIKKTQEIVALNFAATAAQSFGTFYTKTDSSGFIGLKSGYDGQMLNYSNIHLQPPIDYKCEILDSIVVVTHRDGAKGEVRWR
jgi:hypothetical protein